MPQASHLYGLPSHAHALALGETRGKGVSADPYRLYNLDVFEYELNNNMALYGSVPLLFAHGVNATVGLFWFASARALARAHVQQRRTATFLFFVFFQDECGRNVDRHVARRQQRLDDALVQREWSSATQLREPTKQSV